ncbi:MULTISPECIES: hypothetical protein [Amycolatopsis]|uniref:ATP synthase subunit I n=1 Tax=Amycolatopsis tucumanensis TaxID=401106 RepID=A0ABP7JVI7_9PSEU|nr:hypothetical protein [Amycolatopsis tucumanensis]MCF6427177.1 hypothetical protein [Amycolatopsis tucumanensis]
MGNVSLTPVQILAGVGVLCVLLFVWRSGARRARAAADAARTGARFASLAGRVLFNAALIVAVQWVAITYGRGIGLLLVVLGVPALFASYTITRALTVTMEDTPRRRGGRR